MFLLAAFDVLAVDFWWQLATGRWIVENGGVPATDPFSFASRGNEWIELRWLYCLGLYVTHHAGGETAVVLLKALSLALTFVLLARAAGMDALGLAVVGLSVLAASDRFFLRPEIVTFLFLALLLWMWSSRLPAWCSLIVVVVWANSHTLAILGPGLLCLLSLGEFLDAKERAAVVRRRLPLLLGAWALLMATPYGLAGFLFPWQLLRQIGPEHVYSTSIAEFRGPLHFGWRPFLVPYWILLGLAAVSVVVAVVRRRFLYVPMLVAFGVISLMAVRNVAPFALVAAVGVAHGLRRSAGQRDADGEPEPAPVHVPSVALASFALLAAAVFAAFDGWHRLSMNRRSFGFGLAERAYPFAAVDFLEENGIQGDGFSSPAHANVLLWRGYSSFVDGRLEVPKVETYERYQRVVRLDRSEREAFDFFVLEPALHEALIRDLDQDPQWIASYSDGRAVVFLPAESRQLLGKLRRKHGDPPYFERIEGLEIPLGLTAYMLGRYHKAAEIYEAAGDPDSLPPKHAVLYAMSLLNAHEPGPALALLRRVAEEHPEVPQVHEALGDLAVADRDAAAAATHFEALVKASPDHVVGYKKLGRTYEVLGRRIDALWAYRRYAELGGGDPRVLERVRALEDGG